ncbi:MAG: Eco57I restriction-modification methylase domain-containing protein [Candidatus Thorarchaeota archaeon]
MNEFINYLKREDLFKKLLEYYKENQNKQMVEVFLKKFIEKLEEIGEINTSKNEFNLMKSNFNVLGKSYEKALPQKDRKLLGEFYTPKSIVSYILDAVGYNESNNIQNKKLIDISCGSGSFIILAIRILIRRCVKLFKKHELSEILQEEAKSIILRIKENIYGIDVNPIACILCQISIHLEIFKLVEKIKEKDKDYQVPLFNIKNFDSLTIKETEQYDYVIGNPPYLFVRDIPPTQKQIIEKRNFQTNNGQYDYYQIFIELGIKLLKRKGILGYIVPDSLLALSNRSILRKYIYKTTKIREIYNIGPQFEDPVVSNIILVLEKESNLQKRERNYIKVKLSNNKTKEISQKTLLKWKYKFLIHLSDEDINIINYINDNFPKLKEIMIKEDFNILLSRGVELTKKGEIILCENCKKYFPIPKKQLTCPECFNPLNEENIERIILDSIQSGDEYKFKLFINSINRYQVRDYSFIRIDKKGINYKNFEIYKDRLIIRQLSQNNLICATYDRNLSLTSQSFYNLRVYSSPIKEFNNIYLLGILNSKLLSYYFLKLFGSYKKLFPRVLIEKIKDFPISIPKTLKEKELASQVILKVKTLLEDYKSKDIQKEIDDLIFKLYKIPEEYQENIVDFLENY